MMMTRKSQLYTYGAVTSLNSLSMISKYTPTCLFSMSDYVGIPTNPKVTSFETHDFIGQHK